MFMNPARVTNADIDTDYGGKDRDKVKKFLLKDHMDLPQIRSAEIVTFNTIATKGAVKDIGRAFGYSVQETQSISDKIQLDENHKWVIPEDLRAKYKELFEYVDIVTGTVVSIGSHPSGVLLSDLPIDEIVGLCSLSTSPYPVSMLNMKELDALMFVKMDVLGLDNVSVINEACKLIGIDPMTPDSVPLDDEKVWKDIRDDTTLIFQWESESAQSYLRRFMSDNTLNIAKEHDKDFSYIKWFSFGNGLLRPGCASYRDDVADGNYYDNGLPELNEFLSKEAGHLCMQETIMQFLVRFCGYTDAESDNVRRAIAKKYGTETILPEIEKRFIEYTSQHFNVSEDKCKTVIKPFLQVILDASAYSFSWNHSDAYSCIGYISGYLRYYYPLEFLTAALNVFEDKEDKTINIIQYAQNRGIEISPIRFRHSLDIYTMDKAENKIYKGISSIKYLNKKIAIELYNLRDHSYTSFFDLLDEINNLTSVNSNQLDILIKLNFFKEFGNPNKLLQQVKLYDIFNSKKQLKKSDLSKYPFLTLQMLLKSGATEKEKTFTDIDGRKLLLAIDSQFEYKKTTIWDVVRYEIACLGYAQIKSDKIEKCYGVVTNIDGKYSNKNISIYIVGSGTLYTYKVKGKDLSHNPINVGDVVKILQEAYERKWGRDEHGNFYQKEEQELVLKKYSVINDR